MVSSLQTLLDSSDDPDDPVALLYVDLDSFKHVNDTHGHAAGDRVLQIAAERLLWLTRKADLVGRLGGDEFLVALTEVRSPDDARELAQRLLAGLQGPVELNGVTVQLAASIGVSLVHPGTDVDKAMNAADRAMYEAKRGRCGVVLATD